MARTIPPTHISLTVLHTVPTKRRSDPPRVSGWANHSAGPILGRALRWRNQQAEGIERRVVGRMHRAGEVRAFPLTGRLTVAVQAYGRRSRRSVRVPRTLHPRARRRRRARDASLSTNLIVVDGRDMKCAVFREAGSFSIGQSIISLRPISVAEDTTLHLSRTTPTLTLRRSTVSCFRKTGR